ncbi:MAG: CPBP family intramembrane glutamic endopeptidase [Candidatus Acidiferrales bacterium]
MSDSHSETGGPAPAAQPDSVVRTIFMGPNGIRAGWRLLIFFALIFAVSAGANLSLKHVPAFVSWAKSQPAGTIVASFQIATEGLTVFTLVLCAAIMTKIEKRSFADYGLPLNEAFGKRFWQGIPFGFLALSLLLGSIAALHGFSVPGQEIRGMEAVKYGVLFGIGFILVGIFEEFSFRGYMQATLGSGIGFWPAAILLSILFGGIHLGNPGEAKIGAFMAGCFGLVAAFSLQRTGNLWFPIGMHAAWDWGETYFYGVPDSGLLAKGRLMNSSFHGPDWLTGGTVGPEGSYLVFAVLILIVIVVHFVYPAERKAAI